MIYEFRNINGAGFITFVKIAEIMKVIFGFLLVVSFNAYAQKEINTKQLRKNLKEHVTYLADDRLEGRRTGTAGEQLATQYIIHQFQADKLMPYFNNGYIQPFEVHDGRMISPKSYISINGRNLQLNQDYFPLSFSGNGEIETKGESNSLYIFDLAQLLYTNHSNPHFDIEAALLDALKIAVNQKASMMIVTNSSLFKDGLSFDSSSRTPVASIPVVYFKKEALESFKNNNQNMLKAKIDVIEKTRIGHNVVAYIDNGAAQTIILGAHYDHLGYGEDRNSLYVGKTPQIHNGADDNASGTAALIELGRLLKKAPYKNNNYILAAFSGEELGLFGSKYFADHINNIEKINYMINMDMVGRLNDSTRGITIGGYGTSPQWSSIITSPHPYFTIKTDSTGSGPSDHTSFYRKNIPVLFFFTGTHHDYHKPSDDADKINYSGQAEIVKYIYNVIAQANNKGKLSFLKTREPSSTKSSFKVSLGIMPDYTFSGVGVMAEGVIEDRPASKAGMKDGDIVLQIGDYPVKEIMSYMDALNKFNKGETTTLKIKRGDEELLFTVTF